MPVRGHGDQLPEFLRSIFWETKFENIDIFGYKQYIIERVLEYGNDDAIIWLLKAFDAREIGEVVRSSRRISPNTATLWSLVLEIPKEEITCISKPSLLQHTSFSNP